MFKRILAATDGSDYSRHALSAAVDIARKYTAKIELFHVITEPVNYADLTGGFSFNYTDDQVKEISEIIMGLTLDGIDTDGVEINKKTVVGHPASAILDEIRRDIDLVVMGTHGHRPLGGVITGSVTQRILGEASCPVMVVK